jgi:hypothetical protein
MITLFFNENKFFLMFIMLSHDSHHSYGIILNFVGRIVADSSDDGFHGRRKTEEEVPAVDDQLLSFRWWSVDDVKLET